MRSIIKLIKKNLKLLIRSKTSALVVIFGPLLLIFLVGIAFDNSSMYKVNVGVYADSYNEMADSFLDKLSEQGFRVTKFDSEEGCITTIKDGLTNICLTFSADFQVAEQGKNNIVFHVDYSKINLVWAILDTVESQVSERSSELSKDLTNILLERISLTQDEIDKQKVVLLTLTNENNQLQNEINTIRSSLEALNLDAGIDGSDVDWLGNRTLDVAILGGFFEVHFDDMVHQLNVKIKNINMSSTKRAEIKAIMNKSSYKINNIADRLENKTSNLEGLIGDVKGDLVLVREKLEQAGVAREDVLNNIDSIVSLLDNELSSILALQSSVNRIEEGINAITVTETEDIVSPIQTTIKPVTSEKTHLNYIFPSLVVLVVMFISILLSSTLVVMEKTSKAYFRNSITPTRDIIFVLSIYFTSMIILVVQLGIIMLVSGFFFKTQIISTLGITALILLVASTVFVLVGMLIGYLFSSEETATLASISVGSIFLFLSNVILPIESMPQYLIEIVRYNPFVISEFLLGKSVIFQSSLSFLKNDMLLLIGYSVVLFVGILIVQNLMKRHYFSKYAKKLAPIHFGKK